jgi:hypothetical protein
MLTRIPLNRSIRTCRAMWLVVLLGADCVSGSQGTGSPDTSGGATAGTDGKGASTGVGGGSSGAPGGSSGHGGGAGGATTGGAGSGGSAQTSGAGGSTSSGGAGGTATGGAGVGGSSQTGGGGGRAGSGGAGGRAGSGGAGGRAGSGGAGGRAGSGGASGTGSGGTGATAPASCVDDLMDGTETGIDCGGSCQACPNYKINPPHLKNSAQSGCNGGTGFMCTRSMVFSPEFKQAAMDDWGSGDPPFVYGVVGHDKDPGALDTQSGNTCCQCYQLIFVSPKDAVSGLPTPKPMIVQAFNTAAGGAKNFDIYMATGGEGANTAGCGALYTTFPTTGEPDNGGIRPLNFSQQCSSMNMYTEASVAAAMCQDAIGAACDTITSTVSATVQSTSQTSCIEANQPANLYHLNWNVRAERVECPTNLTRVTGCKLNGQGLPQADPTAQSSSSASSAFMTGYGTTTMQDCCRPTCAYAGSNNVAPATADPSYGVFYTCDKSGSPATQ